MSRKHIIAAATCHAHGFIVNRHLRNQSADTPSEESVLGNLSTHPTEGVVRCSQPLLESSRCISSTVNRYVQACPRGRDCRDDDPEASVVRFKAAFLAGLTPDGYTSGNWSHVGRLRVACARRCNTPETHPCDNIWANTAGDRLSHPASIAPAPQRMAGCQAAWVTFAHRNRPANPVRQTGGTAIA
jgi:hypothetical protein